MMEKWTHAVCAVIVAIAVVVIAATYVERVQLLSAQRVEQPAQVSERLPATRPTQAGERTAGKPAPRRYTHWTKVVRPGWYLSLLRRIGRREGTRYEPYLEATTCDWHDGSGNLLSTLTEAQEWESRECNARHAIDDVCALYGDMPMTRGQQSALFEIAYILGRSRLIAFHDMNAAIQLGDWRRAAYELENSFAGQYQSPARFAKLASELRNERTDKTDGASGNPGGVDSANAGPAIPCNIARDQI